MIRGRAASGPLRAPAKLRRVALDPAGGTKDPKLRGKITNVHRPLKRNNLVTTDQTSVVILFIRG